MIEVYEQMPIVEFGITMPVEKNEASVRVKVCEGYKVELTDRKIRV